MGSVHCPGGGITLHACGAMSLETKFCFDDETMDDYFCC